MPLSRYHNTLPYSTIAKCKLQKKIKEETKYKNEENILPKQKKTREKIDTKRENKTNLLKKKKKITKAKKRKGERE